jgi:hypothetical protein
MLGILFVSMFKYKLFVTNTVGVEVAANVNGLAKALN